MSDMNEQSKFGFHSTYFEAVGKLPPSIIKKANDTVTKVMSTPHRNSLNFEPLKRGFYSLRIDKAYRIILKAVGDRYIFVWAAHHDDAYAWVDTHDFRADKYNSDIHIVPIGDVQPPPAAPTSVKVRNPLFRGYSKNELFDIGIPENAIEAVRVISSKEDLVAFQKALELPEDTYQALCVLADGGTLGDVRSIRSEGGTTASAKKGIYSNVKIPEDNEELEKILDASVAQWRVFLHPTQQKIVNNPKTYPMMVRGSAGTGKTVVAMHRARELVRRLDWDPNKKLLFTTFTKNLARDIEQQLRTICDDEEFSRIEVKHIDRWVKDYLKQHDGVKDWRVIFPNSEDEEELWNRALKNYNPKPKFDEDFLKEEWQDVVLPNKVCSEAEYLRVSRRGRGRPISMSDRKLIWPVFQDILNQMTAQNRISSYEAYDIAADLLKNDERIYDAVIVDETQDMEPDALKLLAVLATVEPDTEPRIFLVGDGQQRIFSRKAVLSECGINVRGRRSSRLTITYRTTEQIKLCAEAVLKGVEFEDLDGQRETLVGGVAKRSGVIPEVKEFEDISSEVDWLVEKIRDLTMDDNGTKYSDICIVTRTKNRLSEYKKLLEERGHYPRIISKDRVDTFSKNEIRLATMHRVKGLEFKAVFIVGANEGYIPLTRAIRSNEPILARRRELQERALFYVATSRARDALFVSSAGPAGEYMKMLKKCADNLHESEKKFAIS